MPPDADPPTVWRSLIDRPRSDDGGGSQAIKPPKTVSLTPPPRGSGDSFGPARPSGRVSASQGSRRRHHGARRAPSGALASRPRRAPSATNPQGPRARGCPEAGSPMMTHVIARQDLSSGWVISQNGICQYGVARHGAIIVRSVLCNNLTTAVCSNAPRELTDPNNVQKCTYVLISAQWNTYHAQHGVCRRWLIWFAYRC